MFRSVGIGTCSRFVVFDAFSEANRKSTSLENATGRCDCKANMRFAPTPPIPCKTPLTGLGQFDSLAGQQPRRAPVVQTDAGGSSASSFVPVIDIAPYLAGTPDGKRRVAAELDRACREVGFYIIVGHGVDPGLIEQ